MKRLLLISLLLLAYSCNQTEKKDGYQISATTVGFEDGTKVYVNTVNKANRPVILDSAIVKNNKVDFTLETVESRDFHFLTFDKVKGNVLYLGENNPIEMTIYKDSLRSSSITGGSENEIFNSYTGQMKEFAQRRNTIAQKMRQNAGSDPLNRQKINNELSEAQGEENAYRVKVVKDYPNSLVSIMALTDLISLKAMPAKKVKELYMDVDTELKSTRLGENLNNILLQAAGTIDIGDNMDNFKAPTPDGKELTLKDAMGTVTIVDFWASWCKPCRIENPNVVRIYNEYHNKGLNIIGISLDKKKESWIQAIAQDQLTWQHVSNLQFWQEPIAKAYGVRAIPATFILDETGKVVAKNLRGDDLEAKIKELLDKGTASL